MHPTMTTPPCYKIALIRNKPAADTLVTHSHIEPRQSFIFRSHKRLSSQQLTLWVAVIVCWLGIFSGGHRLSTAETVSKCPTLIQGLWKEPTSWVNSMKGHRVDKACMVFSYSIIFHIYGCATSRYWYWVWVYPPTCFCNIYSLSLPHWHAT